VYVGHWDCSRDVDGVQSAEQDQRLILSVEVHERDAQEQDLIRLRSRN
jgi:hypothetical protein